MILKYSQLNKYKKIVGNKAYNFSMIPKRLTPKGIIIYEEEKKLNNKDIRKIKKWTEKININAKYAVRSSTKKEDARKSAAAGLSDSFISVSKDAIFKKIDLCLKKTNTVIVQEMVNAKISGVCFTDIKIDKKPRMYAELNEGFCDKVVLGDIKEKIYLRKDIDLPDCFSKLLTLKQQMNLKKECLFLEKLFKFKQDIEFSFDEKGKLYILQSRDITKKLEIPNYLFLSHSRKNSFLKILLNESLHLKNTFLKENNLALETFCMKDKKTGYFDFYIRQMDMLDVCNQRAVLAEKKIFLKKILKNFDISIDKIKELEINLENNYFNKKNFFETLLNFLLYSDLFLTFCYSTKDKEFSKIFAEKRKKTEEYSSVPDKLIDLAYEKKFLTKENMNLFYVYYKRKFFNKVLFEKYMKENNLFFYKETFFLQKNNILFSHFVFPKKIKGVIQFVYNKKDMVNFKKGNILVTTMTSPNFYECMNKSKGIITEEGGFLSHASITAREKEIPCIIGVGRKIRKFKNGDVVSFNPKKGNIEIISQKK